MESVPSRAFPRKVVIHLVLTTTLLHHLLQFSCADDSCQMHVPEPIIFSRDGDLKLAYLAQITRSHNEMCEVIDGTYGQYPDLFTYAVSQVNQNDALLPNITLGFTLMDGCHEGSVNLARVWTLLMDNCHHSSPPAHTTTAGKVVGVVGPKNSYQSVTVSASLGLHHIPHIGLLATSDDLSDKDRYKYFQRMVPPDRHQAEMMLDVIQHFGWTYFSLFYMEGSYGENAAKQVTRKAAQQGVCIGFHMMVSTYHTRDDIKKAILKVAENSNNRVIVLFIFSIDMIMDVIEELGLRSHFLLLFGDAMCTTSGGRYPPPIGMLCISFPYLQLPRFTDHYDNMDPFGEEATPWVPPFWEYALKCSWTDVNVRRSCHGLSLHSVRSDIKTSYLSSRIYDAVFVFAHALHQLVQENCPGVFSRISTAADCVDGELLLRYMQKVRFNGYSGDIQFDESGNMQSSYTLRQLIINEQGEEEIKTVGSWHINREAQNRLELLSNAVNFKMFNGTTPEQPVVKSVCSLPCPARHYYHYEENMCCWKCRKCRSNEYIAESLQECIACPQFTWPDEETALTCKSIPITSLGADHSIGIAIIVTGAAGCFFSILVMVIMAVKRKAKLIKACSRELSSISLMGTLLASVTAFLFVIYPSDSICLSQRLLFHTSVSMIFTPILTKTSRVYRIFSSARKSQLRPRFISPKAQLIITGLLLLAQCVLLLLTSMMSTPSAVLHMPVPTTEYVEQHCTQAVWAFLIPLAFNILILFTCLVFGFLTRKLPENFNESWFIFLSVAATLLMWGLMLPTYFTAFYAYLRATILAFCLLVNVFLTLACQYGSKMYALLWVGEENIVLGTMANTTQVSVAN